MTHSDINVCIAIDVMGWDYEKGTIPGGGYYTYNDEHVMGRLGWEPMHYSDQAFAVVDQLNSEGYLCNLLQTEGKTWTAEFVNGAGFGVWYEAQTVPQAICKAALALREQEKQ